MPTWLTVKPLLWLSGGLFASLLLVSGVAAVKVSTARTDAAEARTELAEIRADIADQRETFERLARATEQRHRLALDGVAAIYEQERKDVEAAADRTIADLRAGTVRVQRRLQCPPVRTADVSTSAAGEPVDHGSAQAGLTDEDASDLVRIARDGDAAIVQLGACQSAIRVMQAR